MQLNYTMHTFNIDAYQSFRIHTRLCMKTDREWIRETMADAVADLFWERMKQSPSVSDPEKNSSRLHEPRQGLRDH